jgi:gliding motility-associated lipoprotein GldH
VNRSGILIIVLCIAAITSGCEQSRVFDKNIAIGKDGWFYGEPLQFEVYINDTSYSYNMFVNVRHTDEFPYNNMWMNLTTTLPDNVQKTSKIDVQLSEPDGIWTGDCIDGICYNTVLVQKNFRFPATGKYVFTLEQDMRMNPMTGLLDVGIRVEKFIPVRE